MSQYNSHLIVWLECHRKSPSSPPLLALRAALAVARAVRNQCLRDYNASQREVTHLRMALAKAEKAAREEERP